MAAYTNGFMTTSSA